VKLLAVDDDRTSRTIIDFMAQKWGYEVVLAEDGEAAWDILQQADAPLLMLIDWEMPKLDGLGLCRRIREHESSSNSPFLILLTGRSSKDDVVQGLEAGANDYICKPFDAAELQARLNVGRKILGLQLELKNAQDIMMHEREVIENIILKMQKSKDFSSQSLRMLNSPVEKTSGDIVLSALSEDGKQYIMLGDFTGHGIVAALGGPVVTDIFYAMASKSHALSEIVMEMNTQLQNKLPTGLFMGGVFMVLSKDRRELSLWNCGMSDVLIYRDTELHTRYRSSFLALGIIEQDFSEYMTISLEQGDRIYAYSDGITESINEQGQEFGQDRLEHILHELLLKCKGIDFLENAELNFRGEMHQMDDITLVELTSE